jgi:hypothetical protein
MWQPIQIVNAHLETSQFTISEEGTVRRKKKKVSLAFIRSSHRDAMAAGGAFWNVVFRCLFSYPALHAAAISALVRIPSA